MCRRLFAYRRMQEWPPTIVVNDRWDELYDAAKEDLPVLPTIAEAVEWANGLIAKIDGMEERLG